jgi:hypothetical protein
MAPDDEQPPEPATAEQLQTTITDLEDWLQDRGVAHSDAAVICLDIASMYYAANQLSRDEFLAHAAESFDAMDAIIAEDAALDPPAGTGEE